MRIPHAPNLFTCIVAYYGALFLFGVVGTLIGHSSDVSDLGRSLSDGLWIVFIVHVGFITAIGVHDDWRSYVMVVGIPIGITVAVMKLSGWPRNLAVVALLLAAHAYGLFVMGSND